MQTEFAASWNISATQAERSTSGKLIRLVPPRHFLLVCNPFFVPFCSEISSATSGGDELAITEIKLSHSSPCPCQTCYLPWKLHLSVWRTLRIRTRCWSRLWKWRNLMKRFFLFSLFLFYGRRPRTEHCLSQLGERHQRATRLLMTGLHTPHFHN